MQPSRKMVPLQKLVIVGLASVFLSAKICVNGSGEPHPTKTSIDLTKDMQNSSLLVVKSSEIFQQNEIWNRDGKSLGYSCDSKTYCLSLCCPSGKALLDGNCVNDNTSGIWPQTDVIKQDIHLLTSDPCDVLWLMSSESEEFDLYSNGTVYVHLYGRGWFFDLERHCLFRKPNSAVYLAKVCYPWITKLYWLTIPFIFVSLVMFSIFIVFSVTAELQNLHGMVFRAYLATYVMAHMSTVGQQYTSDSRTLAPLFISFVLGSHYGAGACALWFNVMCFNIWRTFRASLRSIEGKTKKDERKKFFSYAIYAWVTPAVLHTITLLMMCYVPYFRKRPLIKNIALWCCAALLTVVIACNTILYCMTVLRIRKHERDTAHLTKGVNKHNDTENQRVNLHMRLFMITGCHTISWVVWELWPSYATTILVIIIEMTQCILLFVIYVWKDNIRRSLRQQFNNSILRLQSTFNTSPATSSMKC